MSLTSDSRSCDVAVVGAGPVGSYTAYRLALQGLRVRLLEEHAVVGEPRHCTGVLGREAFDRFPDLPREPIHSELSAAWIVSPGGERIRVSWFEGQAFVIHRGRFDQALAQKATTAGAVLQTACRVESLKNHTDGITLRLASTVSGESETLEAKAVIIAGGSSYRLHAQVGLPVPSTQLLCAQTEAASEIIKDVEVYVGQAIAPGSFAWAVPLGNGRVRLGVTAHRMATQHLETLMDSPLLQARIRRQGEPIVKRPVPIRSVSCSVADRVLLAGDAAGQVKPTTGGGIYYGLIGSELASETLGQAFAAGRFDRAFLMSYDRRWKRALGAEMVMGWMGRKMFENLSDAKLDRLVRVCRQKPVADLVAKMADFDWHAKTVFSFLTSPRVLSALL
jgi:digeranylgeranylglycerophospholipid reductase